MLKTKDQNRIISFFRPCHNFDPCFDYSFSETRPYHSRMASNSDSEDKDRDNDDLSIAFPDTAILAAAAAPSSILVPESKGCCWSRPLAACLRDNDRLLEELQSYCASSEFTSFCTSAGLVGPVVRWKDPGNGVFRFWMACQGLLSSTSSLGLVFHGTRKANIQSILENGLDPTKRKGQAYGPGEYFSTTPSASISYCKGELQMMLFLVVITPWSYQSEHLSYKPMDYVVVQDNRHQLPLGVVEFESVQPSAQRKSHLMCAALQKLNQEALVQQAKASEAASKALIIQLIIQGETEWASSKYAKHQTCLSETSKREIGMYAHLRLDSSFVEYYFPNLPAPMRGSERDMLHIETVDSEIAKAQEAWKKYEDRMAGSDNK